MIINENKLDRKTKPKEKKDYFERQLDMVAQQKKAKKETLAKLTNKMKEEGNDNGETLFKR